MGEYNVQVRCVVTKLVYCRDCTEEQARECPWDYADSEIEIEQSDWEVEHVEDLREEYLREVMEDSDEG